MMTVSPCPFVKFHLHDDNGNPASGWKLYSYKAGEHVLYPLYKDASGATEHPNPLEFDSRGEPEGDGIFLDDGQAYKLVLRRPDGSIAWSQPYVRTSVGNGASVPQTLPGRTLYGNPSASVAEATAVPISDAVEASAGSVPSSLAVHDAIQQLSSSVLGKSGDQALDGSLEVSGVVNAAGMSIGGNPLGDLFVAKAGHAAKCVVGSLDGSGDVADIPVVEAIDAETAGQSVPTVNAVRSLVGGAETGLVRLSPEDPAGYLPEKLAGDGLFISVQVVGGVLRVALEGSVAGMAKATVDGVLSYVNDLLSAGDHVTLSKTNAGVQISVPELGAVMDDVDALQASSLALDARVDSLESQVREKATLYGGTIGATSVVISHSLGTSKLGCTCTDMLTNIVIPLNVSLTDSAVVINNLAPLSMDNQIQVVLIK